MAGRGLTRRVADLEMRKGAGLKRWHRVMQYVGQTQDEAIAAYEQEQGPIGADDGTILRVFVTPDHRVVQCT